MEVVQELLADIDAQQSEICTVFVYFLSTFNRDSQGLFCSTKAC